MKRRNFIKLSGIAILALGGCSGDYLGLSSFKYTPFTKPMAIPAEIFGTLVGSRLEYDLSVQDGQSVFFDNVTTPTRGINGALLGPTIRVRDGDAIDFKVSNNLAERFALHWHGMHLPPLMDGNAHQEIATGDTWVSSFTINQTACTNWYHPHTKDLTAQHVYQGIAGFLIIDDANSDALDIPKTYGEDDFPVVVQDRSFNSNGTLNYSLSGMNAARGMMGDIIIVNGVVNPYIDVPNKEVRFRILNGSNARFYNFRFENGKIFKQIASDNAFLEAPVSMNSLMLSPGERAEIVVDFTNDSGSSFIMNDTYGGYDILKIKVNKAAGSTTTTPDALIDLSAFIPDITQVVKTRKFVLDMSNMNFYINGKSFDIDYINETLKLDDVEIWEISNASNMVHNFHMHATHFHIIERSDGAVAPNEQGLKDTVYVAPGEWVKVLLQMRDYADATNPYMYHCHILEHENAGMMGQFVVV